MLTPTILIALLLCIAVYALLSRKLEASVVSLPMVFTALGMLLAYGGITLVPKDFQLSHADDQLVHLIAEITLVLVLFADAARIELKSLRHNFHLPMRMLVIGMPLTLVLGTAVAAWVSPDQPWALALLVAAILTPTDAALGQAVVSNPKLPLPLSQSVNVESGLNDGLALPVVLVAAAITAQAAGALPEGSPDNLAWFTLLQLSMGPLAGLIIGWLAATLLDKAVTTQSATAVFQGIYFLCVAFVAYLGAELVHGNGFLAAFIAGLTFGNRLQSSTHFINEFMEGEGRLLTMATFLIFGAVLAPSGLAHASWKTLVLALLFLTLVRMLPIWLSLLGSGLSNGQKLFLGWFGPRGLATVLFALLILERYPIPGADEIQACVVLTVLISIVAHGLSATPLARRFEITGSS